MARRQQGTPGIIGQEVTGRAAIGAGMGAIMRGVEGVPRVLCEHFFFPLSISPSLPLCFTLSPLSIFSSFSSLTLVFSPFYVFLRGEVRNIREERGKTYSLRINSIPERGVSVSRRYVDGNVSWQRQRQGKARHGKGSCETEERRNAAKLYLLAIGIYSVEYLLHSNVP